jgi:hypothetical protein
MNQDQASDATKEPIAVKLIAAASDGMVNVTPEKVERTNNILSQAFHDAPEPKECGILIFASDGTRCANPIPCFMHDEEEHKKWVDQQNSTNQ